MKIGAAEIDFEAHEIKGSKGVKHVEPKVMDVLSVLVSHAGEVVTRETLIDEVWGVGYGGDERLSRAISLLRKALGDKHGKKRLIQTIPRRGYKLAVVPEAVERSVHAPTPEAPGLAPIELPLKNKNRGNLIALVTALIISVTAIVNYTNFRNKALAEPPLVMIMDSAHPSRIYDEEVKAEGATNADILSDILDDLPIKTQKELISPNWHRYEAVTQFEPDLIVIHYSGFKQEDASGDRPQLRRLIEYFEKTDTEFLIYSRAGQAWLEGNMDIILEDVYKENPELRDRIDVFPLLEYGEPYWKDQGPAQAIKLRIKETLSLE